MAERMNALVDYFKKNLSKGYTEESLKWALINQGHLRSDISRAIEQAKKEIREEGNVKEEKTEKPVIKYELYGVDNKPIKIENRKNRKELFIIRFFRNLFSRKD